MTITPKEYRKDIDGLRAIAVFSVILFHMDFIKNGYLGVDVFFVISGYLITGIIFNESLNNKFSIAAFYLRRIRRILPLVLITTLITLLLGILFMLPNDLENLSHSLFATDLFANNILEKITAKNYWATSNNYDPLMHTWSLAVEEQFYLIYPLLFLFINTKKKNLIILILSIMTFFSLILFFNSNSETQKFYFLQFRFFELSIGGIVAIIFNNNSISGRHKPFLLLLLLLLIFTNGFITNDARLILITLSTAALLMPTSSNSIISKFILENKIAVGIGKISFSLYMWHQIILAFTRYHFLLKIDAYFPYLILLIIFFLSIASYYFIEKPFRNKNLIKNKSLLIFVGFLFLISVLASYFVMSIGGIVREVPELNFTVADRKANDIFKNQVVEKHINYNKRIHKFDKPFEKNNKIKVLVIGNSFARDWCNVLLESKYADSIQLSYIEEKDNKKPIFDTRLNEADVIFIVEARKLDAINLSTKYKFNSSKIWNIGPKNFGVQNGIFYSNRKKKDYFQQTTLLHSSILDKNNLLKNEWQNHYVDLISTVINSENQVPVFTPDNKFISQDCIHFTEAGAKYFANLVPLSQIFDSLKKESE